MLAHRRLSAGLLMVALAAAGGITATIAQGDDPPATASFKTVDGANVFELTSGRGAPTRAEILTGGTVTFANASVEMHSVDFTAPPQGGVSCQQTVGGPSASPLRFPFSPASGTWSGTCTFARAGTYSFTCDVHAGMTGTVVVSDPGAPSPTPTTVSTVTATTPVVTAPAAATPAIPTPASTTATTPAIASSAPAPVTVAKALSITVGLTQRGTHVRGTISGARASARVRVAVSARRGAVGLAGRPSASVTVGSLSASTTKGGALAFAVALDGKTRAALAKHGRLPVTVLVTAPSVTGAATIRTFRIVLRPAGR